MDLVGIEVWAHHGVFDSERRDGQLFRVDVSWWMDLSTSAHSDRLVDTVDYGEVTQCVADILSGESVDLIETLVYSIRDQLLARYLFSAVRVTLHKPFAPLPCAAADVRVTASEYGPSRDVVISLGSNIEPRYEYVQFGVSALMAVRGIDQVRVSSVYQTVAQSEIVQPDFLNVVLIAHSCLPARVLLAHTQRIEKLAHRTRLVPQGPRTLDIDVICVGDEVWDTPDLKVPHPRAAQRRFVLEPWLELNAQAMLGQTLVSDLMQGVTHQEICPLSEGLFLP